MSWVWRPRHTAQAALVGPEVPEDEPARCGKYSLDLPLFFCLEFREYKESLSREGEGERFLFPLLFEANDDASFFRAARSYARNYAAIRRCIARAGINAE